MIECDTKAAQDQAMKNSFGKSEVVGEKEMKERKNVSRARIDMLKSRPRVHPPSLR